jgi:hypothetical protein
MHKQTILFCKIGSLGLGAQKHAVGPDFQSQLVPRQKMKLPPNVQRKNDAPGLVNADARLHGIDITKWYCRCQSNGSRPSRGI